MSSKLSDFVTHQIGGGWGDEMPKEGFKRVAVIRGTDIPRIKDGDTSTVPFRFEKKSKLPQRLLQPGDLIIEVSGGSAASGQHTGRVLHVTKEILSRLGGDVIPASFCKLIRLDAGQVCPSYCSYFIDLMHLTKEIAIFENQSTGISNFQTSKFLDATEPPIAISAQKNVSNFLLKVDGLRLQIRSQNVALEAIAQRLFRSWFVNFDPVHAKAAGKEPEAMSAELAALFPSEFEDSELGPIPKGWTVESLDRSITYLNGLALQKFPPLEGEAVLPVLKIAQLRAGRTDAGALANRKMRPEYVVKDGDIVFSWSGSLEIRIWTGGEAALNQHLFKVFSQVHPEWFCYQSTLKHLPLFRQIAASKATTMGHIQRHHLTEAKIPVAPDAVMQRFSAVFGPMQALIVQNGKLIKELEELRDHLLPRLISGKLSLEEAEQVVEEAMAA